MKETTKSPVIVDSNTQTLINEFRTMLRRLKRYYESDGLHTLRALLRQWTFSCRGCFSETYTRNIGQQVGRSINEGLPHPEKDKILWMDILIAMAETYKVPHTSHSKGYLRFCASEAWKQLFDEESR